VKILSEPLLIGAGDGFAGSGFEGCLDSAEKVYSFLMSEYEQLVKDMTPVENTPQNHKRVSLPTTFYE
jgi:hypothetical protein